MAREARTWDALCFAAAAERDPEKLQQIIIELNVLLESRQEELERFRDRRFEPKIAHLRNWQH
ncbi:MAG TPA: hypothetical protein VFI95_25295 [Terriglobales bacterium]|nr:hypothetical protein [Terriglobales bacterium]